MPTIVLIEKTGTIKENNIKNLKVEDIYKKCNFRKKDDFDIRHSWYINKNLFISVFSRNDGKSGTENKYDLPPPIDKDLYFGTIAIVAHKDEKISNSNITDFSKELWNKTYEKLMGGFEDLNGEDSYSEEEEIPEHLKTSQGYMKDGFVVDDKDDVVEDDDDDDDDVEEDDVEEDDVEEDDVEEDDDDDGVDDDVEEDEEDDDDDGILTSEECDEDEDEHEQDESLDDDDEGNKIYKTNFKIKTQPRRKAKKGKKTTLPTNISSDSDEEINNDIHSELSEEEYQY